MKMNEKIDLIQIIWTWKKLKKMAEFSTYRKKTKMLGTILSKLNP